MLHFLLLSKKGILFNFIFAPLTFIAFLVLKLTHAFALSWFIVLSPLISIPFCILTLGLLKGFITIYDKNIEE